MVTPSVTDWITACSTLCLGVLGLGVTLWQWHKSGFRPELSARVDFRHDATELKIANGGRSSGRIEQILVRKPDGTIVEDAEFEGFPDKKSRSVYVPAFSSIRIIIRAPGESVFADGFTLIADIGSAEPCELRPVVMRKGLSLYDLNSVLPPGTFS